MRFDSAQGSVKAWLMLVGLSLPIFYAAAHAKPAVAQTTPGTPAISVPSEIRVEPAGETPLPIRLTEMNEIEPGSFLLIRGLPPKVTLSEGRSAASGIWAVPLVAVPSLKLASPDDLDGQTEINIALVSDDGRILAAARSMLIIGRTAGRATGAPQTTASTPPIQPTAQQMAAIRPDRAPASAAPELSPEERERLMKFVEKGDESLRAGNITVARLFYQKAADGGLAQGAFALASTYDANQLARLNVVGGIQPDPKLARKWYERARELGSTEAATRLDLLSLR